MTELSDEQAERLARLAARRRNPVATPAATPDTPRNPWAPPVHGEPTAMWSPGEVDAPPAAPRSIADTIRVQRMVTPQRMGRRRSAAEAAKVATVGLSTTAMLGMIAAFGIADRHAAEADATAAAAAAATATVPTLSPAPPTTVPVPATGAPEPVVTATAGTAPAATAPVAASTAPAATAPPVTAAPVAAPAAVDLAVPAPPPPPAPAPQQQAQPQPQAQSSGS